MKKIIAALLLLPAIVFAQSLPSPTYKNITWTAGNSTLSSSTGGATNLNLALTSTYAGPGGGGNNPPNGITVNVAQSGSNANTTKNVRGIVTTAVDGVGNTSAVVANNNFVEGGRFQAVPGASVSYAATYGAVTYAAAGAAGFPYQVGVGIESQVDNLYANASAPTTSNSLPFVVSFLASNGEPAGTFTADAAFMINPFNPSSFQTGFFAAGNTVLYAAFATNSTSATYGMDLGLGSYSGSAIRLPNSAAITGRNAAGNSDLNIMYVSNANTLNLGQGTTSTLLYGSSVSPPVDNTAALGGASNRWSNIFATTVNTNSITGVTNASSASAGSIGETATATGTSVSMTSGATITNITSVSLTAGDWDVTGLYQNTPAGTTVTTFWAAGISTSTGAFGSFGSTIQWNGSQTGTTMSQSLPRVQVNVSGTTTVFCVAQSTFTTSTQTGSCKLFARRVH